MHPTDGWPRGKVLWRLMQELLASRGLAPDDDASSALLLDLVCVDMGGPPCRGDARYHQTLRELVARANAEFRATN
jgi:hypothetical protein